MMTVSKLLICCPERKAQDNPIFGIVPFWYISFAPEASIYLLMKNAPLPYVKHIVSLFNMYVKY